MLSNLLLAITTLLYIGLAAINFQRVNATGDRLVGWGMIIFGLLAAYVLCSLFLTISVVSKGGFSWISSTASTRNIAVGVLWLGMMAGVIFCSMLSTEYHLDQSTGIFRLISLPVYFGAAWLPLLMLVPYTILLHPEWRDSISPGVYKVPLLLASILGLLIVMAPNIVNSLGITIPQKDKVKTQLNNISISILKETSTEVLLQYSIDEDEQVRQQAAKKIKVNPNWERDLIKILENNGEYGHHSFYWVYVFMKDNKVEHPNYFVTPVNNTLPAISAEVGRILKKSFLFTSDLNTLNIDVVCKVLDAQFNDSSHVFRPHMLSLQEALNTPPLEKHGADDEFFSLLNSYQLAVKSWLESH